MGGRRGGQCREEGRRGGSVVREERLYFHKGESDKNK